MDLYQLLCQRYKQANLNPPPEEPLEELEGVTFKVWLETVPASQTFPKELASLEGLKLMEIGRVSGALNLPRMAAHCLRRAVKEKVDVILIECHPKHVRVYERLRFKEMARKQTCWVGQPVVLLGIDLNQAKYEYPDQWKNICGFQEQ